MAIIVDCFLAEKWVMAGLLIIVEIYLFSAQKPHVLIDCVFCVSQGLLAYPLLIWTVGRGGTTLVWMWVIGEKRDYLANIYYIN